jgi:hypothetical protein
MNAASTMYRHRYGLEPETVKTIATLANAALQLKNFISQYIPEAHAVDVRAGQDANGQRYVVVTITATDTKSVLQKASAYALQLAGASGVAVSSVPGTVPGQVDILFTHGVAPIVP